jgi:hypothetical protein
MVALYRTNVKEMGGKGKETYEGSYSSNMAAVEELPEQHS